MGRRATHIDGCPHMFRAGADVHRPTLETEVRITGAQRNTVMTLESYDYRGPWVLLDTPRGTA